MTGWRRVAAINLLVLIVLAGSVELATRTLSWVRGRGFAIGLDERPPYDRRVTGIYRWHPFTGLTLKPGSQILGSHPNQEGRVRVTVDAHGFLSDGSPLGAVKPADEIRLAFIGASTTANLNLAFEDNWPGRLARRVEARRPGRRVRVINAAVPGFDTAQSIGNLALRVLPFEPDVVVVYHAYNDLKAVRADGRFAPDYSHIHRRPFGYHPVPPWPVRLLERSMFFLRTRRLYREMRAARRMAGAEGAGAGPRRLDRVPAEAEAAFVRNLRTLVAVARSAGARVVLSSFATLHDPHLDWRRPQVLDALSDFQRRTLPDLLAFTPGLTLAGVFDGLERYNADLAAVAADTGAGWVDNARGVPHDDRFFVDRVHFTAAGAQRMAENFLPAVLRALDRPD